MDAKHPTSGKPLNGSSSPNLPGAQPRRLTACSKHASRTRNLVVCIDGTANQFGRKNTNVVELYSRLVKDPEKQLTFYNSGIGTRFERILLSAYRWLCDNYQDGDCIFLFGFSRGAYQVRVLSAMIEKVGLIYKGNELQIPFAWELYCRSSDSPLVLAPISPPRTSSNNLPDMAASFKNTFCRPDVKVHFVGAWDTVSSIGLTRTKKSLPLTASGMEHVCLFRHALALDERRVKFLPEFCRGGAGPLPGDVGRLDMPHVKEVWFAGTHSDIGGGITYNDALTNNGPALRWMVNEARSAGLLVGPSKGPWNNNIKTMGEIHESLTILWRPLEILPFTRLSFKNQTSTTRAPHLGKSRQMVDGQLIHESVYRAKGGEYKNRLPPPWNDEEKSKSRIEQDYLDRVTQEISEKLENLRDIPREHSFYTETVDGLCKRYREDRKVTSVVDDLYETQFHSPEDILKRDPTIEQTRRAMEFLVEMSSILSPTINGSLGRSDPRRPRSVPPILSTMLRKSGFESAAEDFIRTFFTNGTIGHDTILEGPITSLAFSPDSQSLAACCKSSTILPLYTVSNSEAFQMQNVFDLRETPDIYAVAYCGDGTKLVVASQAGLLLFDMDTGRPSDLPLHNEPTWLMSLSNDGTQLVSWSQDRTLNIWLLDPITNSWHYHKGYKPDDDYLINWVIFSPSGRFIVALGKRRSDTNWGFTLVLDSKSGTIQSESDRQSVACSMTFSEDGETFYVGRSDGVIEVRDIATGQVLEGPSLTIPDDTCPVTALAISPDGKTLLSGSNNGIRIFDMFEFRWNQRGKPLMRNTPIESLAWSRDGNCFAVGTGTGAVVLCDGTPDASYTIQKVLKADK
ncbi:WD40 repeat-like protein [Marasmius fiardii PR-910]|nr:WD40 repeat-like protein [Marasmius fiardii PR-910]